MGLYLFRRLMTLYLDELLHEVMERHKKVIEEGDEGQAVYDWLEAKDISKESLNRVMKQFSGEATNELFEQVLGGVLDEQFVRHLFFTAIGISFELGYTAAEKQLDEKFNL